MDIQAFCEANGISLSDFGEMAMRDRGFATRLRNGRDVKLSTAERVRQFIAEYRPDYVAHADAPSTTEGAAS